LAGDRHCPGLAQAGTGRVHVPRRQRMANALLTGEGMTNSAHRVVSLFGILAIATALGCASIANRDSAGQFIDDSAISTKVRAAILGEPTLQSAEIKVETFKGEVQLSGFVSSPAAEDRAVAVTRMVDGVVAVRNSIRLK
jgi:hyperosmotically inducible protein